MMKRKGLIAEERQAFETWSPGFLEFPVHRELEHQIDLCMKGIEDAVVLGPHGVGKTESVRRICADIQEREAQLVISDPSYLPQEVVYYEASRATGTKTALLDLYNKVFGGGSLLSARFQSPQSLREHLADEIERRNIRLICIDEAQMIDSANLNLLRQVPDAVRARGHTLGLMLIGNEALRDSLVEIRQLGQRFSGEVLFSRISRSAVAPYLTGFHPHLPGLKESLKGSAWTALEADLFRAVNGSIRRLTRILENANQLVLRLDRPLDEQILRLAIDKLAKED